MIKYGMVDDPVSPVADDLVPPEQQVPGAPVNLIDPKLKERALKRIQGIIKGNGVPVEEVKLEDCQAQVYPFAARTFVKLAPVYGIRIEPGMNKIAELSTGLEAFNRDLANTVVDARTVPERRQSIVNFLFERPDKGFGIKDQKVKFHKLTRDLVMHEGCITCSKQGRVKCQKCGADGMITCNLCHGRNQIICPQCRSTGRVVHGNSHRSCDRCDGDGKIACTRCNGRGQMKCSICAASGSLQCEKCAGTGWLSHLAHVEMEAQMHFDFERHVLPIEVTRMIDAFGSRLVEKGDIEVVLRPTALTPEEIQKTEEPPDTLFIDYHGKAPYGPIQFRIRERIIPAILFGYHGKLIEAPSFLDDITKKGQQVLGEAANGVGNVADKVRRAAKYRMLCDVIIQAAGKARQRQALDILATRYPTGIARERLLALLLQADLALKAITRKPRIFGLLGGLAVFSGLVATYFMQPQARMGLEARNIPEAALIALDALLIPVGMMMGTLSAQFCGMFVQKKAIAGLAPPELMTRMMPKAGKSIHWALAGSVLIVAGLLLYLGFYQPALAPPWVLQLRAML